MTTAQTSDQQQDGRDVIDVLTRDHREVEAMFTELEALLDSGAPADDERREDLVDKVTIELVRHAVAEEVAVYPRVKETLGEEEAERAKREHAEAEETMKRLERMDPTDSGLAVEIRALMQEIRALVLVEECEMFPHMRSVFSADDLRKMGGHGEALKKMAPTRPHPPCPTTHCRAWPQGPPRVSSTGSATSPPVGVRAADPHPWFVAPGSTRPDGPRRRVPAPARSRRDGRAR